MRKVKRCDFDKPHVKHLRIVKSLFDTADKYVPINISDNIGPLSRIETFRLFKSVREIGIPFLPENCAVFYLACLLRALIQRFIFYGKATWIQMLVIERTRRYYCPFEQLRKCTTVVRAENL